MTKRIVLEVIIFGVMMILLLFTHQQKFDEFPKHIHAWTQSDRYALAIGFVNNGGNLFYPETYNLRPQLEKAHPIEKGITGVDLPLPDYMAGTLMRIGGSTSPIYFRMTVLFFSFIGLWGLFRLSIAANLGLIQSLIVTLFTAASPLFHYYQLGFLPAVPCLSIAATGYYFYFTYLQSGKKNLRILAFLLFTLAALIRTPFLIHPIAILISEGIRLIKNSSINKQMFLGWLLIPAIYLPWFFWKQHLNNEFGALFLNQPAYADSLAELKDNLHISFQNWRFHFFTKWHYLFGLLVLFASFFSKPRNEPKRWLRQTAFISLIGGFFYSVLMSKQLVYHDYYFLDAGFLPIILCLIGAMPEWNIQRAPSFSVSCAGLLLIPGMFAELKQTELTRLSEPYFNRTEVTNQNFENADLLLDRLRISKHSKILVIDAYTTNAPLILLKRYGYTVLWTSKEQIQLALQLPFDFVVIQDLFLLSDVVRSYPEIASELRRIGGNGKITVYEKAVLQLPQTSEELLGLNPDRLQSEGSYKEIKNPCWTSLPDTNLMGNLNGIEYGPTWEQPSANQSLSGYLANLSVRFDTLPSNAEIVFKRFNNNSLITTCSFRFVDYLKNESGNQTFSCFFPVSSMPKPKERIQIFIFNPNKSNFVLDEFKIKQFLRQN
jgi:hypothetical protein